MKAESTGHAYTNPIYCFHGFFSADCGNRMISENTPIRRLMLYHHFDKDAQIDDHVIYQLAAYHDFKIDIIFISNAPIPQSEQAKVEPYVKEVYLRPNRGFDWGAWGEILTTRGDALLAPYAELILANCTCYGPLFPITKLFKGMDIVHCDFWSLTFHPQGFGFPEHGQSYFVCLKPAVFRSQCFRTFMNNVSATSRYWDAVWKGEIAFHANLVAANFKYGTAIHPPEQVASPQTNIFSLDVAKKLVRTQQLPFIKVKAFLNESSTPSEPLSTFEALLSQTGSTYPVGLIAQHLRRMIQGLPTCVNKPNCLVVWRNQILHGLSHHLVQRVPFFKYAALIMRCKYYGVPHSHIRHPNQRIRKEAIIHPRTSPTELKNNVQTESAISPIKEARHL